MADGTRGPSKTGPADDVGSVARPVECGGESWPVAERKDSDGADGVEEEGGEGEERELADFVFCAFLHPDWGRDPTEKRVDFSLTPVERLTFFFYLLSLTGEEVEPIINPRTDWVKRERLLVNYWHRRLGLEPPYPRKPDGLWTSIVTSVMGPAPPIPPLVPEGSTLVRRAERMLDTLDDTSISFVEGGDFLTVKGYSLDSDDVQALEDLLYSSTRVGGLFSAVFTAWHMWVPFVAPGFFLPLRGGMVVPSGEEEVKVASMGGKRGKGIHVGLWRIAKGGGWAYDLFIRFCRGIREAVGHLMDSPAPVRADVASEDIGSVDSLKFSLPEFLDRCKIVEVGEEGDGEEGDVKERIAAFAVSGEMWSAMQAVGVSLSPCDIINARPGSSVVAVASWDKDTFEVACKVMNAFFRWWAPDEVTLFQSVSSSAVL